LPPDTAIFGELLVACQIKSFYPFFPPSSFLFLALLRLIKGGTGNYPLEKPLTAIGRDPAFCDIVLSKNPVSRLHCIIAHSDVFCLADVHSRNGTFCNNQRVNGLRVLTHSDVVQVCDFVFEFLEYEGQDPLLLTQSPDALDESLEGNEET
jgi:pSer/pThr/pTyr-binding forkhead associated (FHA) protein